MKLINEDINRDARGALIDYIRNELNFGELLDLVRNINWSVGRLGEYEWQDNEEFIDNAYSSPFEALESLWGNTNYSPDDEYVRDGLHSVESADEDEAYETLQGIADDIADYCIEVYDIGEGEDAFGHIGDVLAITEKSNVLEIEDDEYDLIED